MSAIQPGLQAALERVREAELTRYEEAVQGETPDEMAKRLRDLYDERLAIMRDALERVGTIDGKESSMAEIYHAISRQRTWDEERKWRRVTMGIWDLEDEIKWWRGA